MNVVKKWVSEALSDTQFVALMLTILVIAILMFTIGNILAPLVASIVIAFLLDGLVGRLERLKLSRAFAICLVFLVLAVIIVGVILIVFPVLRDQILQFLRDFPNMLDKIELKAQNVIDKYPRIFQHTSLENIAVNLRDSLNKISTDMFTWSVASLRTGSAVIFNLLIYVVVIPIMVFFLLKDKAIILRWFGSFYPKENGILSKFWEEVCTKAGSYVRGKIVEFFLVWVTTAIAFFSLQMNYSLLLSFLIGVSVVIPYVGAIVVTIPVVLVAYFQWGFGFSFFMAVGLFLFIQLLDGNILVPILFAEAVNQHPLAIIVAVLVFGGMWGIWGIFFAIPLSSVLQAILDAWRGIRLIQKENMQV